MEKTSLAVFVLLYKKTGIVASLIRWQTRGPDSHAAIVVVNVGVDSGRWYNPVLWEADAGKKTGPRQLEPADFKKGVVWYSPGEYEKKTVEGMEAWLDTQNGKPYDYSMIVRFVTRQDEARGSSGKWFCSELVTAALYRLGARPFNPERCRPWMVSPNTLRLSPLLVAIDREEILRAYDATTEN